MRAALAMLLWLGATAPLTTAQEPAAAPRAVSRETSELLMQRGREYLRLGNPAELHGVAEDGNGSRSRTPVLARAEGAASSVDLEENYARRVAMYTTGTTFNRPPATRRVAPHAAPVRSGPARVFGAGSAADTSFSWFRWGVLTLAGPILLVGLLRYVRARPPRQIHARRSPAS